MNTAGGYNNSYGNLLFKEGVITSETSTSYATGGFQKLTSPPLSFVMSGLHKTTGAGIPSRDSYGYYWSSTLYNTKYARILHFTSSRIYPHNTDYDLGYNGIIYGFSLRCVAW